MDDQEDQKTPVTASAMETEETTESSPLKKEENNHHSRELVSGEGRIKHIFSGVKKMQPGSQDNLLSESIEVLTLPWRILVTCRASDGKKYLGVFLQCNADSPSTTWTCFAAAELRLSSSKPKGDLVKTVQHVFHNKENDWGFAHFIEWPELINPDRGFVNNDQIIVSVHLVAEPPHGVNWDSKKLTGYVGLKNQGATCYMNSLLQALFFTNKLRWAVYQMPTDDKDELTRSIPLALQKVFYELQFGDKAVGTKKLTKSFGWETLDSFMQHDVQELNRVLLDNLENKMKGTIVECYIPELFEGKMESYIRCKHVDYESARLESFYDIQLNVKNKKNIYESFDDYVAVESLEGENKYDAGQHGLQEASKGIHFVNFPPVLSLHLMRFQYDAEADANIKINDRFEFPEELSLTRYFKQSGTPIESSASEYVLLAVFVHSGDNHGGHYVVYVNPQCEGQWYKFDDDVVCRATRKEAIDMNFGGGAGECLGLPLKQNTSAYMLVYVRRSAIGDVLQKVTRDMLPAHLVERMEAERAAEIQRKREREEAHLFVTIRFLTLDQLKAHHGLELMDVDRALQSNQLITVRALKTSCFRQVANEVATSVGAGDGDKIRFWFFFERPNQTIRPMLVERNHLDAQFGEIFSATDSNLILYAEVVHDVLPSPSASPQPPVSPSDTKSESQSPTVKSLVAPSPVGTLVFVKLYDPKGPKLLLLGHMFVKSEWTLQQLSPKFAKLANLPANTEFLFFEEVSPSNVNELKADVQISQTISDLMVGDIIVIQPADTAELPAPNSPNHDDTDTTNGNTTHQEYFPTASGYLKDLANRIEVVFNDKANPNDQGVMVQLHLKYSYSQVAQALAKQINTDPERLLFFRPTSTGQPQTLRPSSYPTLKEMCARPRLGRGQPARLFYQRLNMRLSDFENKRMLKCTWVDSRMRHEERQITLHVDKSCRVADVLNEARRSLELPSDCKLRMLEIVSNRITTLYGEDHSIEMLNPVGQSSHRIEEVPLDEQDTPIPMLPSSEERLVPVAHYQHDPFSTFGSPFLVKLTNGESWVEVAKKIQRRLELSDRDFDKYKIAIVQQARAIAFPDFGQQNSPVSKQANHNNSPVPADDQHGDQQTIGNSPPTSPQNPANNITLSAPPTTAPNVTVTPSSPLAPSAQQHPINVDISIFALPPGGVRTAVAPTATVAPNSLAGGGVSFHNLAWIGLDHQNKTPKRARYTSLEKAIKIHN